MSLQLNFSDQLLLLDLSEYDETSLLSHIKACHTIVAQLPSHFDIRKTQECDKEGFEGVRTSPKSLRNIHDNSSSEKSKETEVTVEGVSSSVSIELSPAATDSVRCACLSSAHMAAIQTVQRVRGSMQDILDLFFVEGRTSKWIGE